MTVLLEGNLDHLSLFNLLQFVKMEQKTCGMTISIPEINQSCQMYFQAGLIRYASVNHLLGNDAMYRIIGWWDTGTFTIKAAEPSELPEANIKSAVESILLESARRIDETAPLRKLVPKLTSSLSFSPDAINAIRTYSSDPDHPDWMPEFVVHLPRSFSVSRYFEACPLDDWNACKTLDYLLRTKALIANQTESATESSSVIDAFTMVVMEYIGFADAQQLVSAAIAQTGFDTGTNEHGFKHLLSLADAISAALEPILNEEQHSESSQRLRAKITTYL